MGRLLLCLIVGLSLLVSASFASAQADPRKVLRYSFEVAETTLDPQKISDIYSNFIVDAIFDTPLRYDYLARPLKLVPNTLAAMPTVSADMMTLTFKLRPSWHSVKPLTPRKQVG